MYFRQIVDRVDHALAYVLGDPRASQAAVIDPPPRQLDLVRALLAERGLRLCWLLRTHRHDEAFDAPYAAFCEQTGAVRVGAADTPGTSHRTVGDGGLVAFGDEVIRVLATPGHTPDSVSYLWHDRLFCGDALELGGCGPVADALVDPGQLYDSVTGKLFVLPDETLVFPGHDFHGRTVSTIAEERRGNVRFSGLSRDAFVAGCGLSRQAMPRAATVQGADSAARSTDRYGR